MAEIKDGIEEREHYLVRTTGGPYAGSRVVDSGRYSWPLPDELSTGLHGAYRKVSESQLDPQPPGSHVLRGAEYEWEPADV